MLVNPRSHSWKLPRRLQAGRHAESKLASQMGRGGSKTRPDNWQTIEDRTMKPTLSISSFQSASRRFARSEHPLSFRFTEFNLVPHGFRFLRWRKLPLLQEPSRVRRRWF